jgi:hypothetical protein
LANNPFMPSHAQSLNEGSQDALLQLLKRRAFEEESLRRQMMVEQDGARNAFNVQMRMRDQQQQDEALNFRKQQATKDEERDAAKAARAERDANNVRGAQDIFATGVQNGASREDLVRAAIDGKVPVSMMPKAPVAKETPEERSARIRADVSDRESAQEPFDIARERRAEGRRGTRVAKDTPGAPAQFRQTIQNRIGSRGFENAENAIKTVSSRWQDWRKNYPGLDLNAVRTAVQNLYGQRVSGGGTDAIAAAVLEALKTDRDDQ